MLAFLILIFSHLFWYISFKEGYIDLILFKHKDIQGFIVSCLFYIQILVGLLCLWIYIK
jgi:hypothetical protein